MTRVHPRSVVGRRADLEESADSVPSVDRVPRFILTLIREDQIGGAHLGAFVGSCLTPQAGHLQATFYSDSTSNTADDGASLESIDYRQYQSGATPLALPLRFPGQYYDPETDLHENWHRFYDPNIGRYLEPEPLWRTWIPGLAMAHRGRAWPVYGFANGDPVSRFDPNGDFGAGVAGGASIEGGAFSGGAASAGGGVGIFSGSKCGGPQAGAFFGGGAFAGDPSGQSAGAPGGDVSFGGGLSVIHLWRDERSTRGGRRAAGS